MVKLALACKADLNGVTGVQPKDTDQEPYYYSFTVVCTSCREVHEKPISFSRYDCVDQSGSRGQANFVWRCKSCRREHSASEKCFGCWCSALNLHPDILELPKPYDANRSGQFHDILHLECRGCEFITFLITGDDTWICIGEESNTKFELHLDEDEWYDYDEKAACEVSIQNLEFSFRRF